MKLPAELRSSKKGLINIKNTTQKGFLWCHVRHINPVKMHPERITREDKKNLLVVLIMMGLRFLCNKRILERLKKRAIFALTCFVMKANWLFQFTFQNQNLKNSMDLLLVIMAINRVMRTSKILTDLRFTKRRIKTKYTFVRVAYNALVVKMY